MRSTAVEATKDTGSTDERMSKIEEMLVKLAQQHADTHVTAKPAAAVSSPAHPLTGLNAQQRKAAFVRLCESMPSDSEDDELDNANKLARHFGLKEIGMLSVEYIETEDLAEELANRELVGQGGADAVHLRRYPQGDGGVCDGIRAHLR